MRMRSRTITQTGTIAAQGSLPVASGLLCVLALVGSARLARADDASRARSAAGEVAAPRVASSSADESPTSAESVHGAGESPTPTRSHLVYAELLGKGGAYGIGFEHEISDRLAIGVVGSFMSLRDRQQLWTASPYLHATLVGNRRHAMFGELGASIVHSRIPSQVDDWDGMTDTGAGGLVTAGYERRGERLVFRAYGAVMVGEGGFAPWLGLSFGVRL